jgi:hypothetical protein
MAANPNFSASPKVQANTTNILTANTAVDGTGTLTTFFTAGASGSYVDRISILARGTNVATVLRIFLNNSLIREITMPATTVSQVSALIPAEIPMRLSIPASAVLTYTLGTSVAAGFTVIGFGGDY